MVTPINISSSVSVSAESAIMIDAETGRIVYEKNADERLSMASTTKIITAIAAIENGNPADIVTVSENAASTEGSSVWLSPGEKLTLSELLYALLLESGNDAAVAIAEHVGGSAEGFASIMNEVCLKAGASSTNCVTASGLDDEMHYTTASDMAKIARYAMRSEVFREIVSTEKATIPWEGKDWDRTLVNHNKLLTMYDGVDGIKTGYTKKSGRCLVSSAEKDGWRLIVVTLNAPDDWNDHIKLFDYAYSTYTEDAVLLTKGEVCGEISVVGSKTNSITYGTDEDVSVRKISDEDFNIEYSIPESLTAPVTKGEKIGTATITFGKEIYKTVDLIALSDIKKDSHPYIFYENFKKLLKILLSSTR